MSETVEVGVNGGSRKRLLRTPEEKRRIVEATLVPGASNRQKGAGEMDARPWEKSETARRFKALRRKARVSQSLLAESIGICRQSVSEIENRHVMPHPSTWARFSELEATHKKPKIRMPKHWR